MKRQREDIEDTIEKFGVLAPELLFEENDTSAYKKRRVVIVMSTVRSAWPIGCCARCWAEAMRALRAGRTCAHGVRPRPARSRSTRDLEDAIEAVERVRCEDRVGELINDQPE